MGGDKSKKIRVVVLADVPVWTIPGLERLYRSGVYATWLEGLIPEFKKIAELEMHWICVSKQVSQLIKHEVWNQTFHVLPRGKKSIAMLTGYWSERRKINALIKEINPDVLHAWGTEDVFGLAGAKCKIKYRIFSMQGCLNACLSIMENPPFLMRVQAWYERRTLQSYQVATGESPIAIEHLNNMNSQMKTHLVDYGVPAEFFDVKWEPADVPEIIFVGSVTEAKGIRDLCEAMAETNLKNVKLKVIGDGDLLLHLREYSEDNIEWLGRLNRDGLIQQMKRAWVLVIPTYADTGPSVVKEARVIGLPVITTADAGASCYIKDGKSGFLIEPGNVEEIKQAILSVVDSRKHCIEMGKYQWGETKQLLLSEVTARKFADLYRNILEGEMKC